MTTKACLALLASVLWGGPAAALPPLPPTPQESGTASEKPLPEFKSEQGLEAFKEAKGLFDAGKYAEAKRAFRKAQRLAKSRKDRDLVASWIKGCDAARYVLQVRTLADGNRLKLAYELAERVRPRCAGTPAEELLDKAVAEIEGRLFLPLETFDIKSNRYLPKYGKTFVADLKIVFKGAHCLRWRNTQDGKPGVLKIANTPRDLNRYAAIEFWMNYTIPPAAELVIVCERAQAQAKAGRPPLPQANVPAAFFAKIPVPRGAGRWHRIVIPFDTLKPQGNPDLGKAKDLRIQIPAGKAFDLYIDEIRLMRKDGQEAAKSAPRGRRR